MIQEISQERHAHEEELLAIWEESVRATHLFLDESAIAGLRRPVTAALQETPHLFIIRNDDRTTGFMGVEGDMLAMLFLHPSVRGKGFGGRMLRYAIENLGVRRVDVNEQNPAARAFYEHFGFTVRARSEMDDLGNPWPILHLTRQVLETERLRLCEMSRADFPAIAAMLQDPEVMYAWERTLSTTEVNAWIERNLARYRRHGYGYWLAFERGTGEPIGQIGLIPEEIDGIFHLGIGWMLRRNQWKKGYASEAAKASLTYAFRVLRAGRVIADIRPGNTASIRLAERLGMIHCGEYNKTVDGKIMPHRLYYLRTPLVTVTDYDPHWPEQFELLRKHLRPLLEKFNCRLEHVGSTAVPGLAAKPVIDADCILSDGSQWPAVRGALERFGFFHRGDGGLKGREMFTETLALPFRHNFYVCLPESLHLANHLKLRDYLRETPEAVHHYGALKRRLAERFPDDVDSYCAGKSGLLAEFLQAAGMPLSAVEKISRLNRAAGTTGTSLSGPVSDS